MQAELTETEMETIAKMVSVKLFEKIAQDASFLKLKEAAEKRTSEIIKFYLEENTLTWDVKKMIAPILDEHLKETKVIEQKLKDFMNTEHFKKLELKNLQQRVCQLIREMEEKFENN